MGAQPTLGHLCRIPLGQDQRALVGVLCAPSQVGIVQLGDAHELACPPAATAERHPKEQRLLGCQSRQRKMRTGDAPLHKTMKGEWIGFTEELSADDVRVPNLSRRWSAK